MVVAVVGRPTQAGTMTVTVMMTTMAEIDVDVTDIVNDVPDERADAQTTMTVLEMILLAAAGTLRAGATAMATMTIPFPEHYPNELSAN